MPKKLSLNELNVKSFITEDQKQVTGGITGNNTGCETNFTCPLSWDRICLSGESEYRTACEKTNNGIECITIADPDKLSK